MKINKLLFFLHSPNILTLSPNYFPLYHIRLCLPFYYTRVTITYNLCLINIKIVPASKSICIVLQSSWNALLTGMSADSCCTSVPQNSLSWPGNRSKDIASLCTISVMKGCLQHLPVSSDTLSFNCSSSTEFSCSPEPDTYLFVTTQTLETRDN